MSKQSSVEWLIEQIEAGKIEIVYSDKIHSIRCISSIVEQAKAMHKAEIIEAWIADDNELQRLRAEQYYKDTFA